MIYRKLAAVALAAGLITSVPGCVTEEAGGPDGVPAYRMSVTVVTNATATSRADHSDNAQELGSDAENFIDILNNDFRVIIFDSDGNYMYEMDGSDMKQYFPSYVNGNYYYYTMECEVEFPETYTQAEIDKIRDHGLQVMVLANWQSINGQSAYDNLFRQQSLSEVWRSSSNYSFRYQPSQANSTTVTWQPDMHSTPKRLIPMFGYAKSSKFEARTTSGIHYSTATIPMQRAMAKIEVIDHLENQPKLNVADVTMTKYNTSGLFIPDLTANPDWNQVGSQVGQSSLPTDVRSGNDLQFVHVDNKWIAYVPEMKFDPLSQITTTNKTIDIESDEANARPHLNVKIETNEAINGYDGGTYPAHFARYDQNFNPTIPDDSWNHILRNHIYRFSVNKVGLTVSLHLHVSPWSPDEDELWNFTDHVTVQQEVVWGKYDDDVYSYESYNKDTGEVVLWLDPAKPLQGSFKITTPVNGRWYARLVPIGDAKIDAVSFVDKDGHIIPTTNNASACLEISGLINTDAELPTYFYILPTNFNNDNESRFQLQFYVENLGVWMEVPITSDDMPYTIIRKANLI